MAIFTSNPGHGHMITLPLEAREALSTAYIDATSALTAIVERAWRTGPKEGSVAAGYLEAVPVTATAWESVLILCRSGLDHAQQTATALRDSRSVFGLATLARGCVENFGAAWWLMQASGAREFAIRGLVGQRTDLRYLSGNDKAVLRRVDGSVLGSPPELLAENELRLSELLGSAKIPRRPKFSILASEFGDVVESSGRSLYADLSAVAHGQTSGLGQFVGVTTGTRTPRYVVGLPAWLAVRFGAVVFGASSAAMKYLHEFGFGDFFESDPWLVPHNRALAIQVAIREHYAETIERSWRRNHTDL